MRWLRFFGAFIISYQSLVSAGLPVSGSDQSERCLINLIGKYLNPTPSLQKFGVATPRLSSSHPYLPTSYIFLDMTYMIDLVSALDSLNQDLYNGSSFARIHLVLTIKLLVKVNRLLLKCSTPMSQSFVFVVLNALFGNTSSIQNDLTVVEIFEVDVGWLVDIEGGYSKLLQITRSNPCKRVVRILLY